MQSEYTIDARTLKEPYPGGNTGGWTCAGCHDPGEMDNHHKEVQNYSGNCIGCHPGGQKPPDAAGGTISLADGLAQLWRDLWSWLSV